MGKMGKEAKKAVEKLDEGSKKGSDSKKGKSSSKGSSSGADKAKRVAREFLK